MCLYVLTDLGLDVEFFNVHRLIDGLSARICIVLNGGIRAQKHDGPPSHSTESAALAGQGFITNLDAIGFQETHQFFQDLLLIHNALPQCLFLLPDNSRIHADMVDTYSKELILSVEIVA